MVASLPVRVVLASANAYYVSVTGSDSDTGTLDSPWRSIQYAINKAENGDTIVVKSGTYNEQLTFTQKNGSFGEYLTLVNYTGENPVISGEGFSTSSLISIRNSQYIKITGFEIRNFIAQRAKGIQISDGSKNVEISNCRIHDISTTSPTTDNANPLVVIGNTLDTITNIVIKDNEIYNCQTGWSEGLTINGNVDGWSIINNKVYNIGNIGIDAAGHWQTGCKDPILNQARNGVISGNIVYGCQSPNEAGSAAGIYVDGGKNIIIERNIVHDSQHGIEIGCERAVDFYDSTYKATAEEIIVVNNIIYNNEKQGMGVGGYNARMTGKVVNAKVINNTFYNNQTNLTSTNGEIEISYCEGAKISNNIIYGSGNNTPLINNNSINPVTNLIMNNNILYTKQGTDTLFIWKSKKIYGFNSWKTKTRLDFDTLFGNPGFSNITMGDFHIKSTSIAKNRGNSEFITPGIVDYDGNPRIIGTAVDCGAYEIQSTSVTQRNESNTTAWNWSSIGKLKAAFGIIIVFWGADSLWNKKNIL